MLCVCLFCLFFFFLKVGLLMLQKKGITVIEWLLFACSRSYQLLTGRIQKFSPNSVSRNSSADIVLTLTFCLSGTMVLFLHKKMRICFRTSYSFPWLPLVRETCHLWIYLTLLFIFIYLFIFSCTGSWLLCRPFSSCGKQGLL